MTVLVNDIIIFILVNFKAVVFQIQYFLEPNGMFVLFISFAFSDLSADAHITIEPLPLLPSVPHINATN
jgi:hypothetical protein